MARNEPRTTRCSRSHELPDPLNAPKSHDGICGIVRDLSVETLLAAHARGLHPASHAGPIKWWSPPQRCVLFFDEFHIAKRLRARLRQARYTVTFDHDFDAVMKACAGKRPGKWSVTWITPKLMHAYAALHDAGFAHSFEVWNQDGELVGGGYGVAIGGIFIIESQFAREDNASKIGFCVLNWHLAKWGFALNDNKGPTQHVLEMGFRLISREGYLLRLVEIVTRPSRVGAWRVEADLGTVAAWQSEQGRPDGADANPAPMTAA
jgi:leucyl/phenylalanyl-tRNA---protein transferase